VNANKIVIHRVNRNRGNMNVPFAPATAPSSMDDVKVLDEILPEAGAFYVTDVLLAYS
jgi:hypothetical protein